LQQSQLSQIPNVNASGSYGRSFGRSVDPTSNQFVNADYDFISLSGSANVLLFGWFQTRNTIAKNKLSLQAAHADLDQLKDDVSLNVATGFLRALLAQEQIRVNEYQVSLSKAQLDQTRKFAEAGRVPELNVAQLESQLATDSSNLISAISDYNASILDLKALLNLDFSVPFNVQPPEISIADQLNLSAMNPEQIYAQAARHFGSIRSSELKLEAAQKSLAASKAGLYPQLSLGGQIGTNFASTYKEAIGALTGIPQNTGSYIVDTNGTIRPVYQPGYVINYSDVSLGKQLNNNFRQTVSLSLNIPLFNAFQTQTAVRQSRINVASQELNRYQAELTLKQNVYKAYNDAVNSVQKYNAALRAADASTRAYDFAKKRYDLGLTNTVEYLTTQNNQYRADANLLSAKYDLIFRLKVIDYYLGKELKL
jgi:outer membrane protein